MALAALSTGASGFDEVHHYHQRFQEFQAMDSGRNALTKELLARLEALSSELHYVKSITVANLEADLVDQKAGRRRWQSEVESLQRRLADMNEGRFISVLMDADADIYYFSHGFVSRGLEGGQDAADKLLETIKEYLNSIPHLVENFRNIPVIVKAYANLGGMQKYFREHGVHPQEVSHFWQGFTQRNPFVDFVDVGHGKELADNKIREVLRVNLDNPQCEHVLLACGHDGGYVSFLSPFASRTSRKLTLISAGPGSLHPKMAALGFLSTDLFKPLFNPSESLRVTEWAAKESQSLAVKQARPQVVSTALPPPEQQLTPPKQPSPSPVKQEAEISQSKSWATKAQQCLEITPKEIDLVPTSKAIPTKAYPYNPLQKDYKNHNMKFVANAGRLIPTSLDDKGRRVRDNKLIIDRREDYELINSIKSKSICQWHYLRSDCTNYKCTRNHENCPRPLSSREYDALWFLARLGKCNDMQKFGQCDDEYCIYGHEFEV